MNKAELIGAVANDMRVSKGVATEAVNSVFGCIDTALVNGEKVTIFGFGTFSTAERAARMGRNPATGKSIKIPAKNAVKFKASKELKERVA